MASLPAVACHDINVRRMATLPVRFYYENDGSLRGVQRRSNLIFLMDEMALLPAVATKKFEQYYREKGHRSSLRGRWAGVGAKHPEHRLLCLSNIISGCFALTLISRITLDVVIDLPHNRKIGAWLCILTKSDNMCHPEGARSKGASRLRDLHPASVG